MQNEDTTPDWIYNNIKDAAGQAEKVYFIYLGSILLVLISLSTIPDKALYLINSNLKLPVIQSEVPVEIFVWFAPLLLVFIYIGLQVALYKVHELHQKVEFIPKEERENRVFPFSLYNSLVYPESGIFGTIQTLFAELTTFYSIVFVCLTAFCVTLKGREWIKESLVFAITCFAFILATYYQRRFREINNSQYNNKYINQINAFVWGLIAFCPSFIWLLNSDKYFTNDFELYPLMICLALICGLTGFFAYKCLRERKLIITSCSKFSLLSFIAGIGLWTLSFWLLTDVKLLYQDFYPTNLLIEDIKSTDKFKYGRTINWKGATLINVDMPYFGGKVSLKESTITGSLTGIFPLAVDISHAKFTPISFSKWIIPQPSDKWLGIEKADFSDSIFDKTNFKNASLIEAKFHKATLKEVDFSNADLENADFQDAKLTKVNFVNSKLKGIKAKNANFTDANFTGADLENADLSEAVGITRDNICNQACLIKGVKLKSELHMEIAFYQELNCLERIKATDIKSDFEKEVKSWFSKLYGPNGPLSDSVMSSDSRFRLLYCGYCTDIWFLRIDPAYQSLCLQCVCKDNVCTPKN
jgi:uncharacterized protein YjbI with pentapeptide repeats